MEPRARRRRPRVQAGRLREHPDRRHRRGRSRSRPADRQRVAGLGNGYTIFEPFAMWGQILPRNSFVQLHGGVELPSHPTGRPREVFLRTAVGTTVAQNRGFGRAWSPQVEVLWARPQGGRPNGTWCRSCRSRCRSSSTSWWPAASASRSLSARTPDPGAGLPGLGLVRRRLLRVLEMMTLSPAVVRRHRLWLCALLFWTPVRRARRSPPQTPARSRGTLDSSMFAPSTDCLACHNGLVAPGGDDVSIGANWREHHDGEFGARSVRPGQRAARVDRSPLACRRRSRTSARPATCPPPGDRARGGRAREGLRALRAVARRPAASTSWPSTA